MTFMCTEHYSSWEKKKESLGQYIEKPLNKINKLHGDDYVSNTIWFSVNVNSPYQDPIKCPYFTINMII